MGQRPIIAGSNLGTSGCACRSCMHMHMRTCMSQEITERDVQRNYHVGLEACTML